jgi:hypothetical protein
MTHPVGIKRQVFVYRVISYGLRKCFGYFNDLSKCQLPKETSSFWRLLTCEEDVMAEYVCVLQLFTDAE